MKKLVTLLVVAGLVAGAGAFLGCGEMEDGDTAEMITDLQDRVETLEADVEAIAVSLTELQDEYDEHMEKHHGKAVPERTPVRPGGGEGVKPPKKK